MKLKDISVLVVDDNPQTRELLEHVLKALGVGRIVSAASATKGFEIATEVRPDIILTDWEMPSESGIDFVRRLRASPLSPDPTVPIIMITGYAAPPRVIEARDAGVTEFLVKPFTPADLARRIAHIVNWPRPTIMSSRFIGPDRRRRRDDTYTGPDRRDRS